LARTIDLLTSTGTGVTLLLGASSVARGELTGGALLVFLAYQRTLFKPIRSLARLAARSANASACAARVLAVLAAPLASVDPPLRAAPRTAAGWPGRRGGTPSRRSPRAATWRGTTCRSRSPPAAWR